MSLDRGLCGERLSVSDARSVLGNGMVASGKPSKRQDRYTVHTAAMT